MNTGPLKTYAIQARKDFIQAVTDRAAQLGITPASIAPVQASSGSDQSVVVIAGAPFPASVVPSRERVVSAIERDGLRAVIEHVAYTWFNRLVALRYMEVHDYLDHGLRVLSDPGGGAVPEALVRLRDLDLPTLDRPKAIELAMAGNQDEALYRLILLAQCQHLAKPMPWLFDTRLHDGVDVLLPEHLLATDSLVRNLVGSIPEDDWKQGVEIIGWLYQFFISERKDEVIGSVVAPEDIPAATQLFTPNWIVQYLVQNSVGRLWMESYPNSTLRRHMPYYIEPAPQDPEVQAELDKLIVRDRTPESISVLDPACGSGHILVEAFRLLFQIYLERGHREREIPRLIFANNIFGLDIDDRAAQLACMTLLFEARRHDAKMFTNPPNIQVLAIQQSRESDRAIIDGSSFAAKTEVKALINAFAQAKTLGSLLRLSEYARAALPKIRSTLPEHAPQQNYLIESIKDIVRPLIAQAELLCRRYDAVVANPPYMGGKGMTRELKEFAKEEYPRSKADAFAMFIERGFELANDRGFNSMVTMQSWMFLSSYSDMRNYLLNNRTIVCMSHMDNGVMGIAFGTAATVIRNMGIGAHVGSYCYVSPSDIGKNGHPITFPVVNARLRSIKQSEFAKIPETPVAYWVPKETINFLCSCKSLGEIGSPRKGMCTRDNDHFVRFWHEVAISSIGFNCESRTAAKETGCKWFPYQKGGDFRQWYGNHQCVVDWENDGYRLLNMESLGWPGGSTNHNLEYIFKPAIVWSKITSSIPSYRISPPGYLYDDAAGMCSMPDLETAKNALAFLCSTTGQYLMNVLNPTVNIQPGNMAAMPISDVRAGKTAEELIALAKEDWDSFELSWDFRGNPWLGKKSIVEAWRDWTHTCDGRLTAARLREEANNIIFAEAYKLSGQVETRISDKQISLYIIPRRSDGTADPGIDTRRLMSYAIGCMMGRYSLDHQGIIYAHAGNLGFDRSKYPSFPADADGIIPLTDEAWFKDDATERFVEFVSKTWPAEGLEDNLIFVAKALGAKTNESSRDTIRRYLTDDFYKDHCQTYKKRPIYWLFASGKQRAFQCLVYLHRYNADSLGRMRADYVIPLQGKLQGRLTTLTEEVARAGSTAQRKQAQKALDLINKKIRELAVFDDQLRSYADKRIELDLDDGVKVNIRKFGTLIDLKPLGNLDSEE